MSLYRLTPAAEDDLSAIWQYTMDNWGFDQAETYIRDLVAACEAAASRTRPSRSAEFVRSGYRKIASGRHMIYFRQEDDHIEVIRILHQRMDVGEHLA
ncbi:MAG: type II toxin-antitoxin system RelE/ParE family toxin [Pseudomonadota bacterium]